MTEDLARSNAHVGQPLFFVRISFFKQMRADIVVDNFD